MNDRKATPALLEWRPLEAGDIDAVDGIARRIHPLGERRDVLAEKRALFPAGCAKLMSGAATCGYGLAHPWIAFDAPCLDSLLGRLPDRPDCIHMHDVAILPEGRGQGAARLYVGMLRAAASDLGLRRLACVAVYGADRLWAREGFRAQRAPALEARLQTYGEGAVYMIAEV